MTYITPLFRKKTMLTASMLFSYGLTVGPLQAQTADENTAAATERLAVQQVEPTHSNVELAAAAGIEQPAPRVQEEVVVTGSRIKTDGFNSSTPLISIDSEELNEGGSSELSEYLVTLPGVSPGIDIGGSQLSAQNAGLSSVDLRNLGDNRTLVLIDGRRTVSNSANGNRVSLSTIPKDMIDRVEVITGAASAAYGSDAIAGVLNIITVNDFEGHELDMKYRTTDEGGGDEQMFVYNFGSKFADDRGYVFLSATYEDEDGMDAEDRDWALVEADLNYEGGVNYYDTWDGDQPAKDITQADWADKSNKIPGGLFEDTWYNENGLQPESDFVRNRDGFSTHAGRSLKIPRERYLLGLKSHFDISDQLRVHGQLQYSKVDTVSVRDPQGWDYNDLYTVNNPVTGVGESESVGRIPEENPMMPAGTGSGDVNWYRRFNEVGPQINDNSRETLRTWAGVQATVFDDWDAEFTVGYGRFEQDQTRHNELNLLHLGYGLDVESDGAGGFRCVDIAARANGCTPVDMFGVNSLTPDMANYIRADLEFTPEVEQTNVQAFISGDLFELPAGNMGLAAGVEYRKDSSTVKTDSLSQYGGASATTIPSYYAAYEVYEAFVETNVPLLAGLPGVEYLGIEASARVSDYTIENVGTVMSYSFGSTWRPVDDLLVRAKWGRAQRAPDLTELESPPRGDKDSINDPCDGVTATSAGSLAEGCRKDAGISAAIAADGVFVQDGSSYSSPNAGNQQLEEETSDSITVGLSYQPHFVDDLSIAVDYYKIEVEDSISQFANESILVQCYDSELALEDNPFCADVSRQDDGELSQVIQRQENLNKLTAEGIDTAIQYNFDMPYVPGRFNFKAAYTYVLTLEQEATDLEGNVHVDDNKGELSSGAPKEQGVTSLRWKLGDFSTKWSINYIGEMVDDHSRVAAYEAELAANPAAEKPHYLEFGSVITHDLYMSYTLRPELAKIRVYGGVKNVFDEVGPFIAGVGDAVSGSKNNFDSLYPYQGRYGYLGLNVKF